MNRRQLHGVLLLGACILLISICIAFGWKERQTIMGVPVMNEYAYSRLPEYVHDDISDYFTQNGQIAAVDQEAAVLYISLNPKMHDKLWRIPIKLVLHHPGYTLYFAPDDAFDNFDQAVREGHRFTLLAVAPTRHMRYEVVFTTLPVIRLSTEVGFDEYVHKGNLCVWSDYPSEKGYYSVSASQARWHRRGGWTRGAAKTSYKITLEKNSGENNSMALLDMGRDDDWILNSMAKDDLKLREKTITTLWNEHQKTTQYQIPMSTCHYAEAVIDGQYAGLYLLQRRVDSKMLGQQYAQDVIYKCNVNAEPSIPVEVALDIQYNPLQLPSQELYAYILPFYQLILTGDGQYDSLTFNEDNWLDLNVFCSILALQDNVGSKNLFLIRHKQNEKHVLHFDLWDTDMSMGLGWKNNDVLYKPEDVNQDPFLRSEANARFTRNPQIYAAYQDRYVLLRSTLLSPESIQQTALDCHRYITESGALQRDQEKWGLQNNGEDTLEKLFDFIDTRLNWLDGIYVH